MLNLATILRESARERSDHPALAIGDQIVGYTELHEEAMRVAGALRGLGVRPGQHVAIMFPNVREFTVCYYGCHYAGCPVVPLNVMFTPDELAYHLEDSDSVAVMVAASLLGPVEAAAARVETCRHLIVSAARADRQGSAGRYLLPDLMAAASPVRDLPDTRPDDTAVILYTSGTTGRPKGAELTHFNLYWNAHYVAREFLPGGPDTVTLGVLPLFHSFGQTVIQNATLAAGGTLVLLPRFEAGPALEAIERWRVDFFAGVPTMYFALLRHPDGDRRSLRSLRRCISGGAPMPVEVMREFDRKHGVDVLEGYGLSETSPVASQNPPDRPKKVGSIGLPIRGVEFKLVDDGGGEITEPGVRGEILIKGPNVMKGYYKRPEATAEAVRNGWFRSGDIAHRDADGYYFIVDRKKDMLIRGGYNVYPREVEEVLYAHPAVAEAAVIGLPDERLGEEIKAVVALKTGLSASAEEIIDYCRSHLAAYKYPRIIEFVPTLPKGPTGKILKRELRAERTT